MKDKNIGSAIVLRIRELCDERQITVNRLASISGINQSTLSSLMRQTNKCANLRTVKRICDGLGINITEFFDSPIFSKPAKAKRRRA